VQPEDIRAEMERLEKPFGYAEKPPKTPIAELEHADQPVALDRIRWCAHRAGPRPLFLTCHITADRQA
jgi:hypothetical protein